MLNTITAFVSALVVSASAITTTTTPATAWVNSEIRVSHAAEVYQTYTADGTPYTALDTEDGNRWIVSGVLDATRLYAVVFDTCGTADVENDDIVLFAVVMD